MIKDIIRFTFISAEVLAAFFILLAYLYWPDLFLPVGILLTEQNDTKVTLTLLGLPTAGIIYAYTLARELMAPQDLKEDLKQDFYSWPGYTKLRNRVFVSFGICISCLLGNVILWLTSRNIDVKLTGLIYTLINVEWFLTVLSLAIASLTLKSILGGRR